MFPRSIASTHHYAGSDLADRLLVRPVHAVLDLAVGAESGGAGALIGRRHRGDGDDDEREAALRKDSFLFCLGLLAILNCVGQPVLMILCHVQNWQTLRSASVAASAMMLNATLFGCLPTLYASWSLRRLPKE
jgi:hypothetical protein